VNADARAAKEGGTQGTCETPEDIATADKQLSDAGTWTTLVPMTPLRRGDPATSRQFFSVPPSSRLRRATHLRLNYFPDGGVARLRVYVRVRERARARTDGSLGSNRLCYAR
jgi:allantoicase